MDEFLWHTRRSDELILINFIEEQDFDNIELIAAKNRLKNAIDNNLRDYSTQENTMEIEK